MLINRSGRFGNPLWIDGFFAEINQGEILVTILLWLCDGFLCVFAQIKFLN
jgi:hypothetical protein